MKRIWIYDLETLDIFTATFIDRDSEETLNFVISKTKDQRKELFNFLDNKVSGLVGYNNLHFDAQIIEYLYRYPECTPDDIRRYAQIITSDNDRFPDVPEWKLRIPNLDLFKINHFDNKNRRVGLKWCEFMMDLDNIEDMPSEGEGSNWEEMVLSYNLNDVIATKKLYERTIPMIELRKQLTSLYGINLMNASNSKIGSELLLKLYCKKTRKNPKDVRSLRTYRPEIKVSEIIFPYITFKSEEFNLLLKTFNNQIISKTKKEDNLSIIYKGFQFDYGKGGIHGSVSNKLIQPNDNQLLIDADVSSLYPSIAIVNGLYPKHLGKEFVEVYRDDVVNVRLAEKAKKELGNKAIVEGFKEVANASYGKSNDFYSWLFDPQYTMATTINGQLLLTMLAESLMEIKDLKLIQINTDGLTVLVNKSDEQLYYQKCKDWEKLTMLQLEYAFYSKMIVWDVNNYYSFYTNGKYKSKGRAEFENIPLHKNKSHCIIPYAVHQYWLNNIPVETTIRNHKNIFDFCAGVRARKSEKSGASRYELTYLENSELKTQKLSKTVRYYISNKGKTLYKIYEDGSREHVEAPISKGKLKRDWKVTYFNKAAKHDDFSKYDVNYDYYIIKAKEWIADIEQKEQLNLF